MIKYKVSWKSVQWEPSCSRRTDRRTEGRTGGYEEVNTRYSQSCEWAQKPPQLTEERITPNSSSLFTSSHDQPEFILDFLRTVGISVSPHVTWFFALLSIHDNIQQMKNIYSHLFYWTADISQQMSLQQFTQSVQDGVFQTHKTEPHHQVQYFYLSVTWNAKWVK